MKIRSNQIHRSITHQSLRKYLIFTIVLATTVLSQAPHNISQTKTDLFKNELDTVLDQKCTPHVNKCLLCDKDNACTRCEENLFLNIESKPFQCLTCPDVCQNCDQTGCKGCAVGYYKKLIAIYDRESFVCRKCSKSCLTCSNYPEFCVTCPQYYVLEANTNKCKFKYANIIALVIVFGILIIVLGTYACCQFICKEEKPVVRVTRYGSILDKDPELRQDHLKYDAKTIGINDTSMISEVRPEDNSYMNASNMSREQALTNMIPEHLTLRQDVDSEANDFQFDSSWDKGSMPDFNAGDVIKMKQHKKVSARQRRNKTFKR